MLAPGRFVLPPGPGRLETELPGGGNGGVRIQDVISEKRGVVAVAEHPTLRSSWSRLTKRGELRWAFPGVVIHRDLEQDPASWARAVSAWRPEAVVSGRFAAVAAMGLDLEVTDLLVLLRKPPAARGPVRFLPVRPPDQLVTMGGDLRFTTAEATCLASGLVDEFAPATEALRLGLVSVGSLRQVCREWPGRLRGERSAVLARLAQNPWSVAELQLHDLLRESGIVGWSGNYPVRLDGRVHPLDVALPEMRIGFEVNSFQFHSSREAMARDSSTMNALTRAGWRVYVLTPAQISRHPIETCEFIRSVVNRRHRRGRGGPIGGPAVRGVERFSSTRNDGRSSATRSEFRRNPPHALQ